MVKNDVARLIERMRDAWPGAYFSPDAADTWLEALANYDLRTVRAVYGQFVARALPKPPSLGEFAAACRALAGNPKAVDPAAAALLERTDAEAARMWDDWFKRDPEEAALQLRIAKAARIMATCRDRSSPILAEAIREDVSAWADLQALWARRKSERRAQLGAPHREFGLLGEIGMPA